MKVPARTPLVRVDGGLGIEIHHHVAGRHWSPEIKLNNVHVIPRLFYECDRALKQTSSLSLSLWTFFIFFGKSSG